METIRTEPHPHSLQNLSPALSKLNYLHLQHFLVVAQEQSFRKAGRSLNLSPSTLSEQVALLEKHLGVKLFERKKGQALKLTDAGRLALKHANEIFFRGARLVSHFKETPQETTKDRLRIGISPSVRNYFLNKLFEPLLSKENLFIEIQTKDSYSLAEDVVTGAMDIIISDEDLAMNGSLERHTIQNPSYYIVGPKDWINPLAGAEQINRKPLIHYTIRHRIRREIDLYFAKHALEPHVVAEMDDLGMMLTAVHAKHGYAVVPWNIARHNYNLSSMGPIAHLDGLKVPVFAFAKKQLNKQLINQAIETLSMEVI